MNGKDKFFFFKHYKTKTNKMGRSKMMDNVMKSQS